MKKILLACLAMVFTCQLIAQPSDTYLQNAMSAGKMPGANFVVIKDGHWVYGKSLGYANIDANKLVEQQSIFMMASVSKTMIATAAMQLWEKGRLNLDIDVNHYLPFSVRTVAHNTDSITMRMLLTHTAAIRDNWNVMIPLYQLGDSPISLDSFLKNYLVPGGTYFTSISYYPYVPGAQYNYSNIGSTLAAYVIERITGDKFSHYCDTAIFSKICMDNTSFLLAGIQDTTRIARPYSWNGTAYEDNGLYGYPDYPDGQLRTNCVALARFMTMYMNYGIYEGTRVLDSTTVAYMMQQQTNAVWYQGIIFYAGIGSNGDTLWGHNGGDAGVNTAMYFNAQKRTGVIVLTNGDGTNTSNADLLADTLYKYGLTVTPGINDTFPACHFTTPVIQIPGIVSNIVLYPNPAQDQLFVTTPLKGRLVISDLQGHMIQTANIAEGKNEISLSASIAPGVYIAHIHDVNGVSLAVKRLLIQR